MVSGLVTPSKSIQRDLTASLPYRFYTPAPAIPGACRSGRFALYGLLRKILTRTRMWTDWNAPSDGYPAHRRFGWVSRPAAKIILSR